MTLRDKLTILFTTEPKSGNRLDDIEDVIQYLGYEFIGFDELIKPYSTLLEQAAMSERNKFRRELRNKLTEEGKQS
jgi:hypothetical protein